MAELKTISQIEKAIKDTAKATPYSIAGYSGLFLIIEVSQRTGKKTPTFKHRYTHPITGKRPTITLGQYPAFTLEQARQAYNDNLALLAKGIDPIEHRQNEKQTAINDRKNTLQHFINEWQEIQNKKNLTPKTMKNYAEWLKPIQKQMGQMRVTDIKPSNIIQFIKDIQKYHPAKGIEVKNLLKSILQIAKANGVIEYNPATDLQGTLTPHKKTHYPAITTPAQFAKLLHEIDGLPDNDPIFRKQILQLLALLFVRVGDVCSMKWSDINLFTKQWEFRPQKAGGRDDMGDLITPLPPQAIAILERMKEITGGHEYVFYNAKRKDHRYTHTQEINKILNSPTMNDGKSYKDIHSPHGFRATAKTMLMERLGYDELITELQLGHSMVNSYGRAYSRMDMLEQRRAMMTDWANYLDQLRAGNVDNVIYFDNAKKAVNHE